MDRLEERIASTLMQIEKLKPAEAALTQNAEAVEQEIDEHFGNVTNRILEERLRIMAKLADSTKSKRAQIGRNEQGLGQQLKAARDALSQCRNGQLGKDAVLATVRKALDDELKIGMLDMHKGLLLEANDDGLDEDANSLHEQLVEAKIKASLIGRREVLRLVRAQWRRQRLRLQGQEQSLPQETKREGESSGNRFNDSNVRL